MNPQLLTIPVIAALIGWFTNWVAVKMLFHPRHPRSFLGLFRMQGVFPKRQADFARKVGKIVSNELISTSEIAAHFKAAASSENNMGYLMRKLSAVLTEKLPASVPMLAMFINPEMISTILSPLKSELKDLINDLAQKVGTEVESEFDVHKLVEEKVNNFSVEKLEDIINEIMRKELREIELLGGVLGFFVGCVQLVIISI